MVQDLKTSTITDFHKKKSETQFVNSNKKISRQNVLNHFYDQKQQMTFLSDRPQECKWVLN
jgi:hypothetical protein